MNNIKPGDIIFLTKRDWKWYKFWDYRGAISTGIAIFSKDKLSMEDVPVHTAIVYERDGTLKVAEMDKEKETESLSLYLNKYKGRIIIKSSPIQIHGKRLEIFNNNAHFSHYRYDYSNLFIYQVIKELTGKFIGRNTKYKQICSEFVARKYNLYVNNRYFKEPEEISPKDVWDLTSNWNIIYDDHK